MNFSSKRDEYVYGYVRGFSMWPCFIPGDILKAREIKAEEVLPGDIVVLGQDTPEPVVHRLIEKKVDENGKLRILTAGDRSGPDTSRNIVPERELLKVIGVLRKRVWKKPSGPAEFFRKVPFYVVRLHCLAVRRLFW